MMVILCVTVSEPWDAHIKLDFWVCVGVCFRMRLAFDSVDSVQKTAFPMRVGLIQFIIQTKK